MFRRGFQSFKAVRFHRRKRPAENDSGDTMRVIPLEQFLAFVPGVRRFQTVQTALGAGAEVAARFSEGIAAHVPVDQSCCHGIENFMKQQHEGPLWQDILMVVLLVVGIITGVLFLMPA